MYRFIRPKTKVELEEYYKLRWLLLRSPLGGKRGTEIDELERSSFHRAIIDNQNHITSLRDEKIIKKFEV